MAFNPDKSYQSAQVHAARDILSKIRKEVVVLQEAEFFVDVDTMRDVVDPQGAAACIHFLLGQEISADLIEDPNVVGLTDELERMQSFPAARLAIQTLFRDGRFRVLLRESIEALQSEFQDVAGDTPDILAKYFAGEVYTS